MNMCLRTKKLMGLGLVSLACLMVLPACTTSQFPKPDQGKLLSTGGVTQIEGAGGAGLTPWALITGYGSDRSYGANVFYTQVKTSDFTLQSMGASVSVYDRLELSYTQQVFDTGDTGTALGLGEGFEFKQDIVGTKLRIAGDAVYTQNSWVPQIAVGLQYKQADHEALLSALGAQNNEGIDGYVSATKILLDKNLILAATVRATKANQLGLLGFAGDKNPSYKAQFEGSAVYRLSNAFVAGIDYRTKPDNLSFAKEQDAFAAYIAYFPNKHLSITLAGVDLGDIALQPKQRGLYLSTQIGF